MKTPISPFIKWAGWKRRIINTLMEEFNRISNNNTYFEPFLGGGSVLLNYLPKNWVVNDINEELINTYTVVKKNPLELISFLKTLSHNKETFETIRAWDRAPDFIEKHSEIERAWRFIYMNRTCFNWLYRVNSKNQFNVPFWKYKNPNYVQETNINAISKYLNENNIIILNTWYLEACKNAKNGDFIYLDPPYDWHTDTSNFTAYDKDWFWKEEQKKLAEFFKEMSDKGVYVILSNNDTPFIRDLYKDFNIKSLQVRRSINAKAEKRWNVGEVLVSNF